MIKISNLAERICDEFIIFVFLKDFFRKMALLLFYLYIMSLFFNFSMF